MKKLNTLEPKQILSVILDSETLREKFENNIIDSEMSWLSDKIDCFERGAIDYCFGVACHCYFNVCDNLGCLNGISESIKNFGSSERLAKMLKWSEKLSGTNLFSYSVQKVADLYFSEEFLTPIHYLEEIGYKIYCKDKNSADLLEYVDNGYIDNIIDGVYINENGDPVKMARL